MLGAQEKGLGDYPSPCVWWWGRCRQQTTQEQAMLVSPSYCGKHKTQCHQRLDNATDVSESNLRTRGSIP